MLQHTCLKLIIVGDLVQACSPTGMFHCVSMLADRHLCAGLFAAYLLMSCLDWLVCFWFRRLCRKNNYMSNNPYILELKLIVLSAWTLCLMLGWWTFVCEYAVAKLYVCFAIAVRAPLMFVLVLMLRLHLKEAAGTLGVEDEEEDGDGGDGGDGDGDGGEEEGDEVEAGDGGDGDQEDGELLFLLISELEAGGGDRDGGDG